MSNSKRNLQVILTILILIITNLGLIISIYGIHDGTLLPPETRYQREFLNKDNSRTIFTTYFYWYKASSDLTRTEHVVEGWNQDIINLVNSYEFPKGWPGPTRGEDMVHNYSGTLYHDYLSFHPPADLPATEPGGQLPSNVNKGVMENLSEWFDYQNQSWHEWELRSMMAAGIDVLMPVYWWNGVQNSWSIEGLETLVSAWHSLQNKLVSEGQASTTNDAKLLLPKIAMFYDTTSMKQLWCWNISQDGWEKHGFVDYSDCFENGSGADLSDPFWQLQFWENIDDFFKRVDDDSVFTWDNNYVVWLYSGSFLGNIGTQVFDYCRNKSMEKYGHGLIFIGGDEWSSAGLDGVCSWSGSFAPIFPAKNGIPVGAVGPGYYNLGAIYAQKPIYKARNVDEYKINWQKLMNENAAWIHVETWNEFHEGTNICFTQEEGSKWINATREMATIFHSLKGFIIDDAFQQNMNVSAFFMIFAILGTSIIIYWRDRK
ncbi:MAG: hypothetical protein ACTSXU_07280 [Promethearchaeota archaeon]